MTEAEREVLDQVASVARFLPRPTLAAVCDALERLQLNAGPSVVARALRPVVHPAARSVGRRLIETWLRKAPHLEPRLIAWALRAACTADEYRRQEQTVELVWTGPVSASSALRRTQQALLELIRSTRHSLLIVTFAAYKIPEVSAALVQAAERGVAVTVVIEPSEAEGGKLSYDVVPVLATLWLAARRSTSGPPSSVRAMPRAVTVACT